VKFYHILGQKDSIKGKGKATQKRLAERQKVKKKTGKRESLMVLGQNILLYL
jgi:hypothetical protein